MAISTRHKGTRGELLVFSELLRRGAELYTPLVDMGIDAVVRGESDTYVELQVKSTEAPDQDRYFNFYWEPKENRFFICVSLKDNPPSIWVIPWHEFDRLAQRRHTPSGYRWDLGLPQKKRGHPSGKTREELLEPYCATKHEAAWRALLPP